MKQSRFAACFRLQLQLVKRYSLALLAMALAALLLAAAAALAGRLLYGSGTNPVPIVLAMEEPDERLDLALNLLTASGEFSSVFSLSRATPNQAAEQVRAGSAAAAILLPAGFLDSMLTGENLSPQILLDASRPLETMLVESLAQSAVRLLASAQQGIAFTAAAGGLAGGPGLTGELLRAINLEYITWVLGREGMLQNRVVSATGVLSAGQHYLLGALLFFAVLSLPVLYRLYARKAQPGWLGRLRAAGLPLWQYTLAQLLAGFCALLPMLCLLLAGAGFAGGAAPTFAALPGLLLTALALSLLGLALCNAGSVLAAAGLCFLLGLVSLLVSGGLLPLLLLPAPLRALAPFSPLGWMRDALAPLYGAPLRPFALAALGGFCAVLLAAALLLANRRNKRGQAL